MAHEYTEEADYGEALAVLARCQQMLDEDRVSFGEMSEASGDDSALARVGPACASIDADDASDQPACASVDAVSSTHDAALRANDDASRPAVAAPSSYVGPVPSMVPVVPRPTRIKMEPRPTRGAPPPTAAPEPAPVHRPTKQQYKKEEEVVDAQPSPVGVVEPPASDVEEVTDDDTAASSAFMAARKAYVETATRRYHGGIQFAAIGGLKGASGFRRVKYDEDGKCHFASSSKGAADRRKARRAAEGKHEPKAPVPGVSTSSSSHEPPAPSSRYARDSNSGPSPTTGDNVSRYSPY